MQPSQTTLRTPPRSGRPQSFPPALCLADITSYASPQIVTEAACNASVRAGVCAKGDAPVGSAARWTSRRRARRTFDARSSRASAPGEPHRNSLHPPSRRVKPMTPTRAGRRTVCAQQATQNGVGIDRFQASPVRPLSVCIARGGLPRRHALPPERGAFAKATLE